MKGKVLVLALAGLLPLTGMAEGVEDDRVDVALGFGGLYSVGYNDMIDDIYEANGYDDAGDSGWLNLHASIEYKIAEQFSVLATFDGLVNGVDAEGGALEEAYANYLITPALYGQVYINQGRNFYVNGGVGYTIPNTGSDFVDYENDGVTIGGNVGGAFFKGHLRIEAGYTYIPVGVTGPFGYSESLDFGGFHGRVMVNF